MSRGTRQIIVRAAILIALIAIPLTALYAMGWRLSLREGAIVKTGALAVFPFPYGTTVSVETKRSKTTSAISSKAYFANLIPGSLNIEAMRAGFTPWKKIAAIEPGKTLLFPFAQLWPQKLDVIATRSAAFPSTIISSPKQSFLLLISNDGLKVVDDKDLTVLFSTQDISAVTAVWANESPKATTVLENGTTVLVDLEDKQNPHISPLPAGLSDALVRGDGKMLAARSGQNLVVLGLLNPAPQKTLMRNVIAFGWDASHIIALDTEGYLWRINSENPEEKTQLTNSAIKTPDAPIKIITHEGKITIYAQNGPLWFLDTDQTQALQSHERVLGFEFSPSGEKILFRTPNEVRVHFLKERPEQPQRKKGDETLILRASRDLLDASFAPGEEHVIVSTSQDIRIFELDERGGRNSATILNETIGALDVDLRIQSLFVAFPDGRLVRFRIPTRPTIDIGGAIGL